MTDIRSTIEELFAHLAAEADGVFGEFEDRRPYSVIAPRIAVGRLIFTTKLHIVPYTIIERPDCSSIGTICRYGLPVDSDLAWIRPMASQHDLYFLGDLDPLDLLVFAWLRAAFAPQPITHLGINDDYLSQLAVEIPPTHFLSCSTSEKRALPTLRKVLPDLEQLVGATSMQTLLGGRKLELEAIVSAPGGRDHVLRRLCP